MCAHAICAHHGRPEGHDDHEIEYVAELHASEGEQQIIFAFRGERLLHSFGELIG